MLLNSPLAMMITLPLIAASILFVFLRGDDFYARRNAKRLALFASFATLFVALVLAASFDARVSDFQFLEAYAPSSWLSYTLGIDGVSVVMILLTCFLMPVIIGAAWKVEENVKYLMILLLSAQSAALLSFAALNISALFLALMSLVALVLAMLWSWGDAKNRAGFMKLAIAMGIGGIVLVIVLQNMWLEAATSDLTKLLNHRFSMDDGAVTGGLQTILFAGLILGLSPLFPIWPVHKWLMDQLASAPISVVILTTGLLSKVAAYWLYRIGLPIFPIGAEVLADLIFYASLVGMIYFGLLAYTSRCIRRRFIALNFGMLMYLPIGFLTLRHQGIDGALFYMVAHTVLFAGLFLVVDSLERRSGKSDQDSFGGIGLAMPNLNRFMLLLLAALFGLPVLIGFAGPALILTAAFQTSTWVVLGLCLGGLVLLAGALSFYRTVFAGDLIKESLKSIEDITKREWFLLGAISTAILLLGLQPALVLNMTSPAVDTMVELLQELRFEAIELRSGG